MNTKPTEALWQLKPHVRLLVVTSEHLVLSWLGQRILLKSSASRQIPQVIDALKTPQTISLLSEQLGNPWSQKNLESLFSILEKKGLLLLAPEKDSDWTSDPAFKGSRWHPYFQFASGSVSRWRQQIQKMERMEIGLVSRIPAVSSEAGFLKAFAVTTLDPLSCTFRELKPEDLYVVLCSSGDLPTLRHLSEQATPERARILPVLLDPFGAIVGPTVGGAGRPCLSCVAGRLESGLDRSEMFYSCPPEHFDEVTLAWPETFWQRLNAIVQDEIVKFMAQAALSSLERGAYRLDFMNNRNAYEEVFPVPGCQCSTGYDIPNSDPRFELS